MIPLLHERDMLDFMSYDFSFESIAWTLPAHRCLLCWAPRKLKMFAKSPQSPVRFFSIKSVSLQ